MKKLFISSALVSLVLSVLCIFTSCTPAQRPSEIEPFSFIAISDVHVPSYGFPINQPLDHDTLMEMHNPKRLRQFVRETLESGSRPSLIMNCGDTGDLGWTCLLKHYVAEMQPIVEAGIPVFTVVGNHDLDYAGIAARDLAAIFDPLGPESVGRGGTRYSFDYNGCHFVVVNNRPVTGLIRFNPEELAWLRDDLATVDHDTRVLVFMHANMQEDDTFRIVELLQPFTESMIIQGHRHNAGMDRWGRVPVVLVGSLYGGTPEAGSYSVFDVTADSVVVRIHDYADATEVLGEPEAVTFLPVGPSLDVDVPDEVFQPGQDIEITVTAQPSAAGIVEYRFTGTSDWMTMEHTDGQWKAGIKLPREPGRHFLSVRYNGDDGSVVLAHDIVTVASDEVSLAWSHDLGSAMMGKQTLWNGLAIVPTVEGGVYAFRVGDGTEVWHNEVDSGQILGGLVVEGDVVVYAAGQVVYGCDVRTGNELWRTDVGGTVVAALSAGEGRVFLPVGEEGVSALDAGNGELLWNSTVPLPVMMHAVTDGKRVYFGAMDGILRALDAANGEEVWRYAMSLSGDKYTTAAFWPPVVCGSRVVMSKIPASGEERNMAAFDASTGKKLWEIRHDGGTYRLEASPGGTTLYAYSRGENGSGIQCISAVDGARSWALGDTSAMNAACAWNDAVLVRDGYTSSCIDTATGELIWKYRTSSGPQGAYYGPGAMALGDGTAVIGTMDGIVMGLTW